MGATPDLAAPVIDAAGLESTAYRAPSELVPPGTWYYRVTAQTQDGRTAQAMNKICVQDIYYPGVDMAEVP